MQLTAKVLTVVAVLLACFPHKSSADSPPNRQPTAKVRIVVTSKGFEPKEVTVPVGRPITLQFERKVERSCGTEVVMNHDGKKIVTELPLNKPVELTLTFSKPGKIGYACAMDMIRGSITAK